MAPALRAAPALAADTRSWRGLDAHTAGVILPPAGVALFRRQASLMYALIIPALLPFILLGPVMGMSWWEDRVLPPAQPAEAPAETLQSPVAPLPDT